LAAAQQAEQQKQNRFFVWQRSLGFGPPPELLVDSLIGAKYALWSD